MHEQSANEVSRMACQLFSLVIRLDPHARTSPCVPATSLFGYSGIDFVNAENFISNPFFSNLHNIVRQAVVLNHSIRGTADMIYYWDPLHTGTIFKGERMTCANLRPVWEAAPFHAEKEHRDPSIKAMVRVVCFHGLTTYKLGGGELGRYMLERESREGYFEPGGAAERDGIAPPKEGRFVDEDCGFRSRVLARAIVALGWGPERPSRTVGADGDTEDVVNEGMQERDERYIDLSDICEDERAKQASMAMDVVE